VDDSIKKRKKNTTTYRRVWINEQRRRSSRIQQGFKKITGDEEQRDQKQVRR
jgi:hypothetical protein